MICTVTLNPAIDYVLFADELKKGAVNRAFRSRLRPGGKGINISLVLKSFGLPSLAAGFAAGATGGMLRAMLAEAGIRTDLLEAEGMTRINVKIRAREETDVNAIGPSVREEAFSELCRRVSRLPAGGVLVLAGSAPPSLHADAYARLACAVSEEVRVAVDASGELLRASLACSPWLVKPNREELGELFGVRIGGQEEALFYARKLQGEGARNVIVSLGAQGAVMAAEDGSEYTMPAFAGDAVDTVGAGDSLLAAFIAAKEGGLDDDVALAQGVAAGCATAFRVGLAPAEEAFALFRRWEEAREDEEWRRDHPDEE